MNFIRSMEGAEVRFELKYCERCGGLFVRPQTADLVYCGGCTSRLAALHEVETSSPASSRKPRKPRLIKGPKLRGQNIQAVGQIQYLEGTVLEVQL
jgi:hypothetical protein